LAALSGAATHVLTVVVQEPERFPEALARDSDLDLVETATTQAVKFPFYVQRPDDVDPDIVAMPELSNCDSAGEQPARSGVASLQVRSVCGVHRGR
jgi:hypothetical protein